MVPPRKPKENFMTNTKQSQAPSHIAYTVREGQDRSFWTRIGSVWPHADGNGFSLQLEAFPIDGRVTLRVASEPKA